MKIIIPILIAVSLFFTPVVAVAQSANANPNANKETPTNQKLASRVEEILSRIVAKLESRLTRYEEFIEKVTARRAALAQENVDLTELDRQIRVSQTDINATKAALAELKTDFAAIDYSTAHPQIVAEVVRAVNEVRISFNKLHASSETVVEEITNLSNQTGQ